MPLGVEGCPLVIPTPTHVTLAFTGQMETLQEPVWRTQPGVEYHRHAQVKLRPNSNFYFLLIYVQKKGKE